MHFTFKPLSEHTGAEILDVDLKSIPNKTIIRELNQIFLNIQFWSLETKI